MLVKLCGVKTAENIAELNDKIDMIGINFYKESSRCVHLPATDYQDIPNSIYRVGVFVNHDMDYIVDACATYRLDYIQLHGDENVSFGREVSRLVPVIKVFGVGDQFDFSQLELHDYASYFLFDTRSSSYGGTGRKFNWNKLKDYKGGVPFFLSGGIGPDDDSLIHAFKHEAFVGVDINSRFEYAPGQKNMEAVYSFINKIK